MKENSIEKTIEQLEVILKARKIYKECVGESCTNCNPDIEALTNTIEFLLDYKRVLKENEQLRTEANSLKKDISNMYDEEVIISIISDNFNLSRNEVLKLLGGE